MAKDCRNYHHHQGCDGNDDIPAGVDGNDGLVVGVFQRNLEDIASKKDYRYGEDFRFAWFPFSCGRLVPSSPLASYSRFLLLWAVQSVMVRQIFDDEHGDSNGGDDDAPMSWFDVNSW